MLEDLSDLKLIGDEGDEGDDPHRLSPLLILIRVGLIDLIEGLVYG